MISKKLYQAICFQNVNKSYAPDVEGMWIVAVYTADSIIWSKYPEVVCKQFEHLNAEFAKQILQNGKIWKMGKLQQNDKVCKWETETTNMFLLHLVQCVSQCDLTESMILAWWADYKKLN